MHVRQQDTNRHTGEGGTRRGGTPRAIHFRKIFSRVKVASQIVCLYLVSFRSYKASKMTIVKCRLNNKTYLELWWISVAIPGIDEYRTGVAQLSHDDCRHARRSCVKVFCCNVLFCRSSGVYSRSFCGFFGV